jgi:hypothetical protein
MLKHTVKLKCVIGDFEGDFICDRDTPIPVAKEMLFKFMKHLGQIEDQAIVQNEETPKEEVENVA